VELGCQIGKNIAQKTTEGELLKEVTNAESGMARARLENKVQKGRYRRETLGHLWGTGSGRVYRVVEKDRLNFENAIQFRDGNSSWDD